MAPTMMTVAPANMAFRRPKRSEVTAANGAPTMEPLCISVRRGKSETDLHGIQGEDDRDHPTSGAGLESVLEVWHGEDGGHEGPIVAVGTSATEGNKDRVYMSGLIAKRRHTVEVQRSPAPLVNLALGDGSV